VCSRRKAAGRDQSPPWTVPLGVLLTVMLGHLFACDLVFCNATLHTVPEPKGWSEWPILHDLGGYAIKGRWGIPTYQLYFHDTELRDSGLCPRGGVSLDAWFKEGPLTRGPQDVQLRAKDGTFIASAASKAEGSPGEPTFIVSFRRSAEKELAFALPEDRTLAVLLGIGLLGLLVTGGLARRALATAAAYRDPTRYREGSRRNDGVVVFDDGLPSLGGAPDMGGGSGRVLVRVTGTESGTYRIASSTRAAKVLRGGRDTLSSAARARGRRALRGGFAVALLVLLGTALVHMRSRNITYSPGASLGPHGPRPSQRPVRRTRARSVHCRDATMRPLRRLQPHADNSNA
jgi:hypothetical protein